MKARFSIVFMLHEVNNQAWFESLLKILGDLFTFISADELSSMYANKSLRNGICHLTFDDGHRSFFTNAFPILRKYKVPATVFVSPHIAISGARYWFQEYKYLDRDKLIQYVNHNAKIPKNYKLNSHNIISFFKTQKISQLQDWIKEFRIGHDPMPQDNMTVNEIKTLVSSGLITFGAHTVSHPILSNESEENARLEISDSIKGLFHIINEKINYFAYPNGLPDLDFGKREMFFCKECGIQMAFTTQQRHLSLTDNVYAIPRVGIAYGDRLHLTMKMLFPQLWTSIKDLKPHSERAQRLKLYRIMQIK